MSDSLEDILVAAQSALLSSQKIYSYGNNVMLEFGQGTDGRLITLALGHRMESVAESLLANFFVCEGPPKDDGPGPQFAPPRKFLAQLLNRTPTRDALPRILNYATRPIFDPEFVLAGRVGTRP